jgi:ferredoxin-NADP reductase
MPQTLEIKAITPVAHNVFSYDLAKPYDFPFDPGQATDVAIDEPEWREKKRPFTFTSLPDWDRLQFTIKSYHDHDGVTDRLAKLLVGDRLVIDDPWGTIAYKGPGVFIAGGAGITPFISIFRNLNGGGGHLAGNTLIFANKAEEDIILREELEAMPGLKVHHILSKEEKTGFTHGRIDKVYLEKTISDFSQNFYLCGPDSMMDDLKSILSDLGAKPDALVFEQ